MTGHELFRVWPDGTVQAVADGWPYSHMSDDFLTVSATDEDGALQAYLNHELVGDLVRLTLSGGAQ